MIKAGIYGASGYTGYRLIQYLSRHSQVNIAFATSRADKGKKISDLYGSLSGICDIKLKDPDDIKNDDINVLFTCAPDQTSMKVVPEFYKRGISIIDLAGDFRMDSGKEYKRWYGEKHTSPELIKTAVYGLSEINREQIGSARLVSNPGCYPTSVILGIYPLLKKGCIDCESIHVFSSSGISGAGKSPKPFKLFYETDSNVLPYSHGRIHKHAGEMEQELSKIAGDKCTVTFAPQVVPIKTGILSTIMVTLDNGVTGNDMKYLYQKAYDNEKFVRFNNDRLPETKFVADTNFCDIGFTKVEGSNKAIIVSAICNLGKGASGQAVQNMNIMFGFDEDEGLL